MDIDDINNQNLVYLARNNRVKVTEKFIVFGGIDVIYLPISFCRGLII